MGTRASHHWHDTQGNHSTLPATQQRTSFSLCKSINGAKKTNSQKDPLMAHCSSCFSFLSPFSNFWKSVNQTKYQRYLQTNNLPPTPSPTSPYHTMTIYNISVDPNSIEFDSSTMSKNMSKHPRPSPLNAPSPTNVASFPFNGWMTTTRPTKCIVPGRIGQIIDYKDYYFESERVLCTQAFLVTTVSTTIDNDEFPPGSTELDEETGHNCKMTKIQYRDFT